MDQHRSCLDDAKSIPSFAGIGYATLLLLITLEQTGAAQQGDPPSLVEIREAALTSRLAIDSIEFKFDVEQSTGWIARGRFYHEDDQFRTEREDVTGLFPTSKPGSYISAYDRKRSQFFSEPQSLLTLKDGSDDARYTRFFRHFSGTVGLA